MSIKFKLKSHPNKLLYAHLKTVGECSKKEILSKDLNLTLIKKEQLADISYLIGISHDFGKALDEFQRYLKGDTKTGPNHSPISSILTFELVREYCRAKQIDPIFAWAAYLCVKKHHGDLSEINDTEMNRRTIKKEITKIRNISEIRAIYQNLLREYDINCKKIINLLDKNEILTDKFDERKLIRDLREKNDEQRIELYLIVELLFSVLVDFDKKDAAEILTSSNSRVTLKPKIVEDYIHSKIMSQPKFNPELPQNKLKNKFYKYIVNNRRISKEEHIYSITAPTGIGKTLTSFALATKLREKISQRYKIHYILPFTTLIDQNFKVFSDVLRESFCEDFNSNESKYILKHHYLSLNRVKLSEQTKLHNYLDELLFIKSWDSNIVVSTYIQLLKTIIGSQNSFLNKFHNIVNSIIILDEVQFIDNKHWKFVNKVFNVFSKRFKTYFILMTATQPKIFSKDEAIELSSEQFFNNEIITKQREIIFEDENKSLEEFSKEVIKDAISKNRKQIIIVVNTKKCSRRVYEKIRDNEQIKGRFNLIYLSKNLIPKDIKESVKKIKELYEKNEPYIIVTTQLIEAGVDISSEILYRDIAIAPAIIQSAGRCNRFHENPKGIVKIVKLVNDEGQLFSTYIYDKEYVKKTIDILRSFKSEQEIIRRFFDEIENDRNDDELLSRFIELKFDDVDNNFKLINNNFPTEHVFFEIDKKAKSLLEEYKNRITEKDKKDFEALSKIKLIRKEIEQYCIDISRKDFSKLKDFGIIKQLEGIFYIPKDKCREVYDSEVGFDPHAISSKDDHAWII